MSRDKRANARRRTRLRSGKVADPNGVFLTECLIYDRSTQGARLRVAGDTLVPDRVLLFDDELNSLSAAAVAWRRPYELGVRFMPEPETSKGHGIARKLSGKYYAL
jgi:hypothetical protein